MAFAFIHTMHVQQCKVFEKDTHFPGIPIQLQSYVLEQGTAWKTATRIAGHKSVSMTRFVYHIIS